MLGLYNLGRGWYRRGGGMDGIMSFREVEIRNNIGGERKDIEDNCRGLWV